MTKWRQKPVANFHIIHKKDCQRLLKKCTLSEIKNQQTPTREIIFNSTHVIKNRSDIKAIVEFFSQPMKYFKKKLKKYIHLIHYYYHKRENSSQDDLLSLYHDGKEKPSHGPTWQEIDLSVSRRQQERTFQFNLHMYITINIFAFMC